MSEINTHLGKTSQYKSTYDKSLLVREARQNNRTYLGISDDNLPFVGYDIWNAYEVSTLLESGLPISVIAKVTYSSDSKYIVESKSIKLYFNSFNMEKRGGIDSKLKAMKFIEETASADLSELLETNVEVTCFHTYEYESMDHNNKYLILEEIVDFNFPSKILYYSETPSLLKIEKEANKAVVQRYRSSLLKSNCKVTSQPDWGDVFIHCKSNKIIDKESLLSYIVSFRDECHFHEEICEAIYKRLLDTYQPEELLVYCYYVRRGGIDINPIRASSVDLINVDVIDPTAPFLRTGRQ